MKKLLAFTLAEVLITLSIIGIVAALTIPTLINNYQKTQYVTGLKKAYTQFNQVLSKFSSDRGCVNDLKCTGEFTASKTNDTLGQALVPYFKLAKDCGDAESTVCFTTQSSGNYDGTSTRQNDNGTDYYKFLTVDGVAYAVRNYSDNCSSWGGSGKTNNLKQVCGGLRVDVNGPDKGPNSYGRDIFSFNITNGKGALLYPVGGSDEQWTWWNGSPKYCAEGDKQGYFCTGRVIEEGWEMNY